jgi:large subunit ribosomal protein L13e
LVFPKKSAKPKSGDATQEQLSTAVLLNNQFPVVKPVSDDIERVITTRSADAYATLRKARSDKRLKGKRDARRKAKEAEEAEKKK